MVDGAEVNEKSGAIRGSELGSSPRDQTVCHAYHKSIDPASSLGAMQYVQPLPTSIDGLLGKRMSIRFSLITWMLALVSGT
jgi:hypothetical protein